MFIAIKFTVFPGAVIAAAAFLIGRILANIFLFLSCPKVLKEFREG
jgi:uncharacterized BrkB/YihY/UPF0761 family membrane protein